jgi:hypothetical protein
MRKLLIPDPSTGAATPLFPHDTPPTTPDPLESSGFEKIAGAAQRAFEKYGIVLKRGRGRPKKDGTPKASDVVQPEGNLPGAAPAAAGIDPLRLKLLVAGAVGALKGAVRFAKGWCKRQAGEAGLDKEFTEKTLLAADPGPEDYQAWGEAFEVCAKQYGWDFEHMPAVVLAVETGKIFAPFVGLAQDFRAEIKRNRERQERGANPPAGNGGQP